MSANIGAFAIHMCQGIVFVCLCVCVCVHRRGDAALSAVWTVGALWQCATQPYVRDVWAEVCTAELKRLSAPLQSPEASGTASLNSTQV